MPETPPAEPEKLLLIIDDEPEMRHSLRRYFEGHGYTVRTAADVDEAIDAVSDLSIMAIILDVRMPDPSGLHRSGLDVLAFLRLQERFAQIPVMILTGQMLTDEEQRLLGRYNATLFRKPEAYSNLLRHLSNLARTTQ